MTAPLSLPELRKRAKLVCDVWRKENGENSIGALSIAPDGTVTISQKPIDSANENKPHELDSYV